MMINMKYCEKVQGQRTESQTALSALPGDADGRGRHRNRNLPQHPHDLPSIQPLFSFDDSRLGCRRRDIGDDQYAAPGTADGGRCLWWAVWSACGFRCGPLSANGATSPKTSCIRLWCFLCCCAAGMGLPAGIGGQLILRFLLYVSRQCWELRSSARLCTSRQRIILSIY